MLSIADRYLLKELIYPFLFGIALFTTLFMATGPIFDMANLVIQYGVPVWLVLKYAVVRIPSFLEFTVPMSVLLATLVAFSRLSVDHEIIAMKASGINFYRILIPVFIFAGLATGFCYVLNTKIAPESLYKAKVIVASRAAEGHLPPLENIKFSSATDGGGERITIAKHFNEQEGLMWGPVINDYAKNGILSRIIHAREARWQNSTWILVKGEIFQFDEKGMFQSHMTFSKAELNLPKTPREVGLLERSPDEMESPLLKKTIAMMEKDPEKDKDQIHAFWMRYHLRQALPFSCLVFALIGAPSGIRPVRSTSSSGVAMSVFIVLIYYFFVAVSNSLGEHGTLPAVAAAWIPNVFFFLVGSVLLVKETT